MNPRVRRRLGLPQTPPDPPLILALACALAFIVGAQIAWIVLGSD